MNLEQIRKTLEDKFNQPCINGKKRHLIFWYDEQGEFAEDIAELNLANAKLWKLTANNNFITKYQLEVSDRDSNYLVYSNLKKPQDKDNWLLDILLYSGQFSTDKISVLMNDLDITDQSLKPILKKYAAFFNNKERYAKFVSYGIEEYTEEKIDLAILAVLCKQKTLDLENLLKALLLESLDEEENKLWQQVVKFAEPEVFWKYVEREYGFILEDKSLKKLFLSLLISSMANLLNVQLPAPWQSYLSKKRSNCLVFLDHWMNHAVEAKRYDELAGCLANELNLNQYLQEWEVEQYIDCDFFPAFDKAIILKIVNSLLLNLEEYESYQEIISIRRTKHFYQDFANIYEALAWAVEIFKFRKKYAQGLPQKEACQFLQDYTKDYYLMDKAYRNFYTYYDQETETDVLKKLRDQVEGIYANWYLPELSIKWSNAIEEELLGNWSLSTITQQKNFYRDLISPRISNEERVFVIISDALRYEAGEELAFKLNTEIKGSTELTFMQGVVPSYTKLGMACLLPGRKVEITDKEEVLVDGMNTAGLENREKILQKTVPDSLVIKLKDLNDLPRNELRESLKGKKLIYIYHDTIDATGDKAASEIHTFKAVKQAIEEIQVTIRNIVNNLSATNIYVTADHGFIYRREALEESDKVSKGKLNALAEKRRFVLLKDNHGLTGTLSISLQYLLGEENNLYALVPRGADCFKVQGGGENFVHGGASLQEIVIPVIKYKNDRKEKTTIRKVDVKVTNTSRKVTNTIFTIEFFQSEKVEDKLVPRKIKAYFADNQGNKISNEISLIADKTSSNPNDRIFRERFTLKNMSYSRTDNYYLILEDEEAAVEKVYEKIPFNISLGIVNDFDF